MVKNIGALVTLFYPDTSVCKAMRALQEQVSFIVLLDNTPETDNYHLFTEIKDYIYIQNNRNIGLSQAFNKGLTLERVKKSDFIIFFDQDSLVPENLVDTLINDYSHLYEKNIKVGCIGPAYFEVHSNKAIVSRSGYRVVDSIQVVKSLMTSGMLTTYTNMQKIGFWNEALFLDLADWDLCWRFQKEGYLCCLSTNTCLVHRLGSHVRKSFFLSLREGTPIREYYQMRDTFRLIFKNYTPFKMRIFFIFRLFFRPILHLIFFPQRKLRAKYIFYGIIDGLLGKQGIFFR